MPRRTKTNLGGHTELLKKLLNFFNRRHLENHPAEFKEVLAKYKNKPRSLELTLWNSARYRILINLVGIGEKVRSELGLEAYRLYGGLIDSLRSPSFAASHDYQGILVVNPGSWMVRIFLSAFPHPTRTLKRVLAAILAHEVGHLLQRNRGYGWQYDWTKRITRISGLIVWLCLNAWVSQIYPAFLVPVAIFTALVTMGLVVLLSVTMYALHPLEWDANLYSLDNWREWEEFLEITRLD